MLKFTVPQEMVVVDLFIYIALDLPQKVDLTEEMVVVVGIFIYEEITKCGLFFTSNTKDT
jgi:hypothetical protein